MSKLIFSKAVDKDISSSIEYIKNMLEAPMASHEKDNSVSLVRFMHSKMDWANILMGGFEVD